MLVGCPAHARATVTSVPESTKPARIYLIVQLLVQEKKYDSIKKIPDLYLSRQTWQVRLGCTGGSAWAIDCTERTPQILRCISRHRDAMETVPTFVSTIVRFAVQAWRLIDVRSKARFWMLDFQIRLLDGVPHVPCCFFPKSVKLSRYQDLHLAPSPFYYSSCRLCRRCNRAHAGINLPILQERS